MAKFATHMGDPRGNRQTSPQQADPHGFLVWFSLTRPQVHVDRRVRKAFQPEFGAYVPGFGEGFEIALEPSELQKEGENPGKRHFYFPRQTLVCTKPWFKRDLTCCGLLCGSPCGSSMWVANFAMAC